MYKETIRSSVQRHMVREDFGKVEWNHFLTMRFNLKLPYQKGEDLIERWDWSVNRQMIGPRFNKKSNLHRRMVWFGCMGYDTQDLLHIHLNVQTPLDWNTGRFRVECRESFSRLVENGEVHFSVSDFTERDRQNMVDYTTKFGHLGTDESGLLDTSSVVVSRNVELVL